jgi:hypothetical protein
VIPNDRRITSSVTRADLSIFFFRYAEFMARVYGQMEELNQPHSRCERFIGGFWLAIREDPGGGSGRTDEGLGIGRCSGRLAA